MDPRFRSGGAAWQFYRRRRRRWTDAGSSQSADRTAGETTWHPLFHRQARAISLTVEGEAWLPHVRLALEGLRDSTEAVFGTGHRRLTLSASQTIIDLWLLPRLGRLQTLTKAEISIQSMVIGTHDAPQDDVIRIRYGTGDWPHTYRARLYAEEISPVAAPSLMASTGHWTTWPRISCAGQRPGWHDWATEFAILTTPLPDLRFDTHLSALGAAKAGLGVFWHRCLCARRPCHRVRWSAWTPGLFLITEAIGCSPAPSGDTRPMEGDYNCNHQF